MSIPKKHHYIPRTHIAKFKRYGKYFLFLKEANRLIETRDPMSFFREKELNSIFDFDTRELDHSSIEKELEKRYDRPFNHHFTALLRFVETGDTEKLAESLGFFFEYGVMAYFRFAKTQDSYQKNVFPFGRDGQEFSETLQELLTEYQGDLSDAQMDAIDWMHEEFKLGIKDYAEVMPLLKYPVGIPTNLSEFVPKQCFATIYATDDDSFLLPDRCTIAVPSNRTFSFKGVTTAYVSEVAFSLSPRLFICIYDAEDVDVTETWVMKPLADTVSQINSRLFSAAKSQVLGANAAVFAGLM